MTKTTKTQIGPTRELQAPGHRAKPGNVGYFTVTPVRLAFDENEIGSDKGDLRDWKGRFINYIDLEQPDEDTRYREIADYMVAYWNAMDDMQADEDERKSANA